jgi:hypothetical protein
MLSQQEHFIKLKQHSGHNETKHRHPALEVLSVQFAAPYELVNRKVLSSTEVNIR